MSKEAAAGSIELSPFEKLRLAREILQLESRTLWDVAGRLDRRFCDAVDYLYHCRGRSSFAYVRAHHRQAETSGSCAADNYQKQPH